jgi:hypothetical protein
MTRRVADAALAIGLGDHALPFPRLQILLADAAFLMLPC